MAIRIEGRDDEPGIDHLPPSRRPRQEDEKFIRFLQSLPCIRCGAEAEAAHVRMASPRHGKSGTGAGTRPHDRWAVPLCPACHRLYDDSQHAGNELEWWIARRIDPLIIAALLFSHYKGEDRHAAEFVCRAAKAGAFPYP